MVSMNSVMACLSDGELEDLHAGLLPDARAVQVREHLAGCTGCRQREQRLLAEGDELLKTVKHVFHEVASKPRGNGAAQSAAPTPPTVPDYDVVKRLGKGGFGEVWLAKQRLTGVFYAVKVIPKTVAGEVELDGIRAHKQRASNHAHLIQLEHVGETDEFYYYVMELADDARGSGVYSPDGYEPMVLSEELRRRGALPPAEAAAIVRQILNGLGHLHEAGLLHRDIKPANIIRRDGQWKLGDMGLVTRSGRISTKAGTPSYGPPESVRDRSGDLYCVGTLLSELLSGTSARVPLDDASRSDPRLGRKLADAIAKACAGEPGARFQTATEMIQAITSSESRPATRRGGFALMAVAAVALAALGVWAVRSPRPSSPAAVAATLSDPLLEVHFKESAKESGYHKLDERTLPLATGSLFQVVAKLPKDGYPYLFFVTSGAEPMLLYPEAGRSPGRVQELYSPSLAADTSRQMWHTLTPPAGTEMLLLLVADEPVDDLDDLKRQIRDVEPPELDRFAMLEGAPDHPLLRWNTTRGAAPNSVRAPKGLKRLVEGDWRLRFRSIRVLAFPHVESGPL